MTVTSKCNISPPSPTGLCFAIKAARSVLNPWATFNPAAPRSFFCLSVKLQISKHLNLNIFLLLLCAKRLGYRILSFFYLLSIVTQPPYVLPLIKQELTRIASLYLLVESHALFTLHLLWRLLPHLMTS